MENDDDNDDDAGGHGGQDGWGGQGRQGGGGHAITECHNSCTCSYIYMHKFVYTIFRPECIVFAHNIVPTLYKCVTVQDIKL